MKLFALWCLVLAIISAAIFSVVRNARTKATQATKENAMELFAERKNRIIIHCADPDYAKDFAKFIEETLHFPERSYFSLSVLGGASVLAHCNKMQKQYDALLESVQFYAQRRHVDEVVLITHWHCKYCLDKLGKASWDDREKGHLAPAADKIREVLPKARVICYYAKPGNNCKLLFHPVAILKK